jgi:hypothetical protein
MKLKKLLSMLIIKLKNLLSMPIMKQEMLFRTLKMSMRRSSP